VILRVHEKVRSWLASPGSSQDILDTLGGVVGARLAAIDALAGERILPGTVLDPVWVDALRAALDERAGARPISMRLTSRDRTATAVQIPLDCTLGFLVAEGSPADPPRIAVLQHVAAACALEIARVDAAFHEQLWSGAAILSEALQGLLHPTALAAALADRGIEPPFVCVVLDAPFDVIDRLNRSWLVRGESHLMTRAGTVTILLHADEARLEDVRALCSSEHVRAGVSEPFAAPHGLADASKQARWALETVPPRAAGLAPYGSDAHSFLPRTLLESQHAVERILGPLLAYDDEHGSELVKTLEVYLECDRSPKQAALRLYVHNQTIHYRLARIQELTDRSLRSTADISDLWCALRALALSQTAPARP
jgi:purine catabolism regulator